MRFLPLAATALILIAAPAWAQQTQEDIQHHGLQPTFSSPNDSAYDQPSPSPDAQPSYSRAERLAMRPYRAFDWDRPEPGKTGYFADDYRTIYSSRPKSMGMGDRVYRGRDGLYYCRNWEGFTKLIENDDALGELLPAGGSERLRVLSDANPALAAAVKGREVRCGGTVVIQLKLD